jgi:hypothetical protein
MNTSTRANYANADQAHASTAKTPLLRSYGLVMPQATTSQTTPSQWEENPDLHCQAIAAEYQWALNHSEAQLPITAQLCTDARNWLQAELSKITSLGFWPLFTDAESSLAEALAAFNQPHSPNALVQVPITNQHNDPHPVWSPLENLLFRFVHDYHHWVTCSDATFTGELAVMRHILTPALRHNDALARFLASEIIGQASTTIATGAFPVQIIARNILTLI